MKNLTIGIVSEGPTDFELIEAIITHLVPGNHRYLPIQPDMSESNNQGEHGAGWKGVFSWCQSIASLGPINEFIENDMSLDALIIQLDGDVARESEIDCYKPCPPSIDTVNALKEKLNETLKISQVPQKLIYCIPVDNLETWVFCAYLSKVNPNDKLLENIECIIKPDDLISKPPYKLIKRKDGKPKKTKIHYRENIIPLVLEQWEEVKKNCEQASLFEKLLLSI